MRLPIKLIALLIISGVDAIKNMEKTVNRSNMKHKSHATHKSKNTLALLNLIKNSS